MFALRHPGYPPLYSTGRHLSLPRWRLIAKRAETANATGLFAACAAVMTS
jgi:hypothetical protein